LAEVPETVACCLTKQYGKKQVQKTISAGRYAQPMTKTLKRPCADLGPVDKAYAS
jgi:hypothetical protein